MYTREILEEWEDRHLAPYAVRSRASRGRVYPDHEPEYRTAFQRDRDRIIHTTAFRRLEYKTQVFVISEGDYYRTRLTHTLEVAQIGRTIALALGVNEALTEAVCLGHDLGHPAFGHSGEETLNELMAGHGGFDHNRQSLRIVEKLEKRYEGWPGLNLTWEVREGMVKHETDYDVSDATGYEPDLTCSLEGQIANVADELAYTAHDLDDGLHSGLLGPGDLRDVRLWQELTGELGLDPCAALGQLDRHRLIRSLIGWGVDDVVRTTSRRLEEERIDSLEKLRGRGAPIIGFSEAALERHAELKLFLLSKLYRHWRVMRMGAKARRVLQALFETYVQDPAQLPDWVQERDRSEDAALERIVCDYIAGMTDRFALEEYARLFDPTVRV
ncbi:MAG: deoxyguanosinetriphosphate triphosphohydrolase [Anaerolineae bacterium]|jgi:dGTPase|nr:deoxyguanosinetriphosphate triphosphohydrolase [Anaerolineae bacterium]